MTVGAPKETRGGVRTVSVKSLGQAFDFVEQEFHGCEDLLFRGQADHHWDITTRLQRVQKAILGPAYRADLANGSSASDRSVEREEELVELYSNIFVDEAPNAYHEALARFGRNLSMLGDPLGIELATNFNNALAAYNDVYYEHGRGRYSFDGFSEAETAFFEHVKNQTRMEKSLVEGHEAAMHARNALDRCRDGVAALAQHYQFPTHLLDFTRTFVAASFFASQTSGGSKGWPCIYVFDVSAARKSQRNWSTRLRQKVWIDMKQNRAENPNYGLRDYVTTNVGTVQVSYSGNQFRIIDVPHPLNLHQRSQQGVLISNPTSKSFEDVIAMWHAPDAAPVLTKIILQGVEHDSLELQCAALGLTAATAYFTLSGFAQEAAKKLERDLKKVVSSRIETGQRIKRRPIRTQ